MKNGKAVFLITLAIVCTIPLALTNVEYCRGALTRFTSYWELKEFLQTNPYNHDSYAVFLTPRAMKSESLDALDSAFGLDYSRTNVQVEGVDEADLLKTDGEYIYMISGRTVVITKAYPAETARVSSKIITDGEPKQLFIYQERLVALCENTSSGQVQTSISMYDVSNKDRPTLHQTVWVDGRYFSSRMIGDYVYVIVKMPADLVYEEVTLPSIVTGSQHRIVSASDIYYSSIADRSYEFSTIVAINVHSEEPNPIERTILSGGTTSIYVSLENIYFVTGYDDRTYLHRINVKDGKISIAAEGEVQGRVLNQFSMDEYGGHFRVATTSRADGSLRNNVYVMNMRLGIVGKIENIALGETIHSARFMENLLYLVTFRKTDPFFIIDLSDPHEPEVLGELKIPGYSDYLHPYDRNHIIGVGKETVPADEGDFSWFQGVKISLFSTEDLSEPKELAKYEIGDRGTDTPVLTDHKAFLFNRDRNLLVIPVSVASVSPNKYPNGDEPFTYGQNVWQGAYVFTVSLEEGKEITLRGTVTHVEDGNLSDVSRHIFRALYINDVLYTVSQSMIKMNSLTDLTAINELSLN